MKGYYPEYYLRKRQREQAYRKVMLVIGTLGILALAVVTGYIIFSNVILPRRTAPGATVSLAEQRQQLETDEKLRKNESQPGIDGAIADSGSNQALDLNANAYALSFPLVQVSVDGSGAPMDTSPAVAGDAALGDQVADARDSATTPDTVNGVQAPSTNITPTGVTDATTPQAQPGKDTASEADKASVAEKPAEKKKPEDKAAKPQDKPVKPEEKKPAPSAKGEDSNPPDSGKSNTGSGKKIYRVYAGTCKTRSDADLLKEKASSTGVSASVVKNGADYFILVSTVGSGEEALNLREKLIKTGFNGAFVTQKTE